MEHGSVPCGGTHDSDKVKKINKRRDEFTINNGCIVIRYTANIIKNEIDLCIKDLELAILKRSHNNHLEAH